MKTNKMASILKKIQLKVSHVSNRKKGGRRTRRRREIRSPSHDRMQQDVGIPPKTDPPSLKLSVWRAE
jgi:hypothetical protein